MKPTRLISRALAGAPPRALSATPAGARLTPLLSAALLSAALLSAPLLSVALLPAPLLPVALLPAAGVSAQYKPVDEGSSVRFAIDNFGFAVTGSFTGLQGAIDFDPQNAGQSRFEVSIDAATVNTDNSLRDSHLRNDGYFDVKDYPRIVLLSTRVVQTGAAGVFRFIGQLTIKGKTQPIDFPFTVTPAPGGLRFSGSFRIRRKDFGVGGTSTISNDLTVSLLVVAKKGPTP